MLSIIICSVSPELLQQVSQNIQDTVGVEHEIIAINNKEKKWPIARAYNEGARRAQYPFLLFVHEDVMFHSPNWGPFIEDKLKEPDCGAIGFAGSEVKLNCYSGWTQASRWVHAFYYQREGEVTNFSVVNVDLKHPFEEVVTLDGLGIFVRKDVWSQYPFDEQMLTGFHCYDLDFTLQIAAGKQYKNYVCCSPRVLIEHFSKGNYNSSWCQETIRMHDQKWNKMLPLAIERIKLSKQEINYHGERCFNSFMRKMFKVDFPGKRAVLWAFLIYPQPSLKHVWHCFMNICTYLVKH